MTFELAPNEFIGNDEMFGFLPSEAEPYQYLTIEDKIDTKYKTTDGVYFDQNCT